ncbi:MAG TPA: flagellar assembly protein A [Spirochaetia bacterium]|nr:flagellar assembly protein A [Spirochaetia bacterium]
MHVKGDLKLEIDERGLEARITIVPNDGGEELSTESLLAVLDEKKVREGIDTDAIDAALRTLARRKGEPVSFVAAAGVMPRAPEPETVDFEPCPIPLRLEKVARAVLDAAPKPKGFRLREEKVRKEKKVLRKPALPFLPPREEVEVVVEKKQIREDVEIDPAVSATGFVRKGTLVARVRPGKPAKEGRSIFGRLVPAERGHLATFLFLEGLTRTGGEAKAATTGFLRRGANWADIVAFSDHRTHLSASADGATCLLSFEPGDKSAPVPSADEIIAEAEKIGFPGRSLLSAREIATILEQAVAAGVPLTGKSLSPSAEGAATVTASEDRLSATLYLRKGRGGGRTLTLALASDAIRLSKVRRYTIETVRKDLQAFFKGSDTELVDYPLAAGQAPERGKDGSVEWLVKFLPAEEADRIRAYSSANRSALEETKSFQQFPLEKIESMGLVKAEMPVLRIVQGAVGAPGVDVFGTTIPGLKGATPEVRLFEGLQQRRDLVVAQEEGVLEKGSDGMAILLRVRKHRDAELTVTISDDRMKAFLSFVPARGTGSTIDVQEARARIKEAGVVAGVDEAKLLKALDLIARGKFFKDTLIAQGKLPPPGAEKRVIFHVRLATGKALTILDSGRADFRAQDRITHVAKGAHLATVKPPPAEGLDSWDVTGKPIPPAPGTLTGLQPGRGISVARQPDGSLFFYSEADGELVRDGSVISILEVHSVAGDVDMKSGNINFPGVVRVNGSVQPGFRVIAAGDIEVEDTVDAAILSSEGSILVGQGIKGEGKAILRAKKDIAAPFAEQAVLVAAENVHLKGACLRCNVKCNGRLYLDSEKGNLVGGEVRARQGVSVQNLGSPTFVATLVLFGQDYLLQDQIEREQREVAAVAKRVVELDVEMKRIQREALAGKPLDAAGLAQARMEKARLLKTIELRKKRLIALHDTFDLHVPSEVVVRGTLYPGVIIESHGRRWETRTPKNMITLRFDQTQGKVVEKL